MKKATHLKLVCLSLILGWILAGLLLRFLFGSRIYMYRGYYYFVPSDMIDLPFVLGYYGDRLIDAVVYAAVIYLALNVGILLFKRIRPVRYP
jgi:hypothetical protein